MAEEPTKSAEGAAAASSESSQVFKIQRVYLKDVSYESPKTPSVFIGNTQWQPNVSLHLNTESSKLDNDLYECILTVTATVKLGEDIAYLIEIKQAGLFLIRGFEENRLGPMLGSFCPNLLFRLPVKKSHRWCKKADFRNYCWTRLILMPCTLNMLRLPDKTHRLPKLPSSLATVIPSFYSSAHSEIVYRCRLPGSLTRFY